MCKTKFPSARMAVAKIIVDRKGFIEQSSVRLQGIDQPREKRSVEVEADDDSVICIRRKFKSLLGCPFKVNLFHSQILEMVPFGRLSQLSQTGYILIDGSDIETMIREIERMPSASAGHVQDTTFR